MKGGLLGLLAKAARRAPAAGQAQGAGAHQVGGGRLAGLPHGAALGAPAPALEGRVQLHTLGLRRHGGSGDNVLVDLLESDRLAAAPNLVDPVTQGPARAVALQELLLACRPLRLLRPRAKPAQGRGPGCGLFWIVADP